MESKLTPAQAKAAFYKAAAVIANHHWPDTAAAVTPVLTETAMTFDALMASLREPSNV